MYVRTYVYIHLTLTWRYAATLKSIDGETRLHGPLTCRTRGGGAGAAAGARPDRCGGAEGLERGARGGGIVARKIEVKFSSLKWPS